MWYYGVKRTTALFASYAYDAWGKCTILSGNDSVDSIANINPFRYRSYYYDTETGLYYLETRYYDPEIGRFISADSIEYLDPKTIGGLNLFAYCNNNPVMYADPTGHAPWGIIAKLALTVAVVALCLTGVGAVAALAATATAVSITAAVTASVACASIAIASGAISGAVCAEQSGGNWYDGAMAGAIGSSIGTLISSLTSHPNDLDSKLRMNVLGRAASSFTYDITYEFFTTGAVDTSNLPLYAVDVVMDVSFSTVCYYYTGYIPNNYLGTAINGITDGVTDSFQTEAYFTP